MGLSLKETVSRLSFAEQAAFLADLDVDTLQSIAREDWWWVQRPEQVPPDGDWSTHIYMAGRGAGKTRSGAEWLVQRTIDHPYDSSGFPTERMVMAYNLSDCRTTCIEGPSGILRVLRRRGFEEVTTLKSAFDAKMKYHYTKSPKPHITLLETESKIHFTGADPDAPRGFNLADVWCVARGEPVATDRGLVPIEEVAAGDQVWTSNGWCTVEAAVMTKRQTQVLRVETTVGSVRVTPEHLVWANGSWFQAGQLVPGDVMATCLHGPQPSVLSVEWEPELYDVFDLKVQGARHFYAGSGLLKIHNCDEIVKWQDASQVWREGIRPALRADVPGDKPRAFITTTPKPILILQNWVQDNTGRVSIVRGSTFDNSTNLSEDFLEEVKQMYEGTALGRQELYGELLDMLEGALFSWRNINEHRVDIGPEKVSHRSVGVDPGLTGDEDGDEMGVVVACRDFRNHIYVVADETVRLSGTEAALHAWKVFANYQCETMVIENNLAKAWLHQVMLDAFRELQRAGVFSVEITKPPLVPVHSNYGKKIRAQPIANRYSHGMIHHIGVFDKLEQQMLLFDPLTSKHNSPDRMDALVHVCQHLIEGEAKRTKVISPLNQAADHLNVTALGAPGNYW